MIHRTEIRDLNEGLSGTSESDKDFLHKYMVLTSCDLLFADKIVLIEGPTERIMLPELIRKVDSNSDANEPKLSNQYLSVMEVGGAHAHIFLNLLNFLDLSTLIITDIDSVDKDNNNKACEVSKGNRTSNSCLKKWFGPEIKPVDLIAKTNNEKTQGRVRLAYQIPEIDSTECGRSFEDAFILANHSEFELNEPDSTIAYGKAQKIKKTNFAITYGIDNTEWHVPRYIAEGLQWLATTEILPPQDNQNIPVEDAA